MVVWTTLARLFCQHCDWDLYKKIDTLDALGDAMTTILTTILTTNLDNLDNISNLCQIFVKSQKRLTYLITDMALRDGTVSKHSCFIRTWPKEIIIMHWHTTTYIISSDDSLKCRERWMEVTDDKSFGRIFTIVNINV